MKNLTKTHSKNDLINDNIMNTFDGQINMLFTKTILSGVLQAQTVDNLQFFCKQIQNQQFHFINHSISDIYKPLSITESDILNRLPNFIRLIKTLHLMAIIVKMILFSTMNMECC